MKRKPVIKTNKKYLVIGLLAALLLSLYYLSLQKKKEGLKGKKRKEGMDTNKKNKSTEQILREKLEGFKKKIEKMKDEKEELKEEKEGLERNIEKIQSKLNNAESINKIKF